MKNPTGFYEKNIEFFRTIIQDLRDNNYLSFLSRDKDTLLFLLAISYFSLSKDAFIHKDLEETTDNRLKSQISVDWKDILSKLPSFSYSPSDMKSIEVVDSIRDSIMHGAINFDDEKECVDVIVNGEVPYKQLSAQIPYEWFVQYYRTLLEHSIITKEYSYVTCLPKAENVLLRVANVDELKGNIDKLFSFVEFNFSSSKEFNLYEISQRTVELVRENFGLKLRDLTREDIEQMSNLMQTNPNESLELLMALEDTKKGIKDEFGVDFSYTFKAIDKEKAAKLINFEDGENIQLSAVFENLRKYLDSMQASENTYLWMQRIMRYFDTVDPQKLSKYTEEDVQKIINPSNSLGEMIDQIEDINITAGSSRSLDLQRDKDEIIKVLSTFLLQSYSNEKAGGGSFSSAVQIYSKEMYIEEDEKRKSLELKKSEKEKELEDEEKSGTIGQNLERIRQELQEIDDELAGLKINQPNRLKCINGEYLLQVDSQEKILESIIACCKSCGSGEGSINISENGKVELVDYSEGEEPSICIEANVDLYDLLPKVDLSIIQEDLNNLIFKCQEIQKGKVQIIQALLYSCFINCYVINKEKFDKLDKDSISIPDNMHSYAANMYKDENKKKKSLESKRAVSRKRLKKLEANREKAQSANGNLESMDKTIETINQELSKIEDELAKLRINDPNNIKCIDGQNLVKMDIKEDIMRIIRNCFSHKGRVRMNFGEDNKVRLIDSSDGIASSAYIETDIDSLFEFLSQEAFKEVFKKEEETPVFNE